MKNRNLLHSFSHALRGLTYVLNTQRSMRIHLLLGTVVLIGAFFLCLSSLEFIILCCTVASVSVAEMINTSVELTINFIVKNTYHPLVKVIKDIAAGGVLITSVNAVIVGCVIFGPHLRPLLNVIMIQSKGLLANFVLIGLILTISFVLIVCSRQGLV